MATKKFTEERRQALRAKRILSIQYRLVQSKSDHPDKRWYISTTHDMSVLGISFLSEIPFNIDDILELQVIMSGIVDVYKGYGQVVRVSKKPKGAFYLVAVKLVPNIPKKSSKKSTLKKKKTISPKAP